jgi:hypothetical protein
MWYLKKIGFACSFIHFCLVEGHVRGSLLVHIQHLLGIYSGSGGGSGPIIIIVEAIQCKVD